jgi:hypothetical protein
MPKEAEMFDSKPVIRKPRTAKMPWRTSDDVTAPVVTRRIGEPVNVILAATHPDVVAATSATVGSRGICGCGAPVTKVSHPALGDRPRWIHDANPEVSHAVANVRCITR